ncbi:MAG: T9SS type A sorting domain-containing protein, partial [Saprospiraceae bacterium]|nr:T9SS type A sorting domain-containing protein [Saprospiraceae bacterium]
APLFSGISTNNLTPTSVDISWGGGSNNQSYTLEYGVSGYSLGSGFSSTTPNNTVTLEGLNPNVSYDVYVRNNCGGVNGNSIWIGPITFHTPFDQTPDTCSYTLTIQDLLGSGWEGAVLNVENNGINNSYTLDFFEDELTFNIVGYQNQPINFTFVPSVDNNIGRFILTDQSGNEVINQGPMPTTETITTYACPTCGGPSAIRFDDLNGDNVEVSWSSNPVSAGTYQLVYGYGPFTIADGTWINTTEDHAVLTGLNEDTEYNFYIRLLCTSGDSSGWAGPFLYKTRRFNDVGIVAIINPEAVNCSLGQEEIKVRMKNFGALPQTLIPFKYSINGVTANIPIPQDGFYTGVISSDSTEELTFTTIADLSGPGVYEIAVWTELDNDSRRSNDTTRISVYSSYPLPFSENFEDDMLEDGWSSTSTAFDPIGTAHNSGSNVFYQNLYSGQPTVELVTRQYGIVALGDTLSFDYRMVDYPSGDEGTQLGTDDKLLVQISEDCGDNFGTIHVINIANHTTSAEMATKKISLDNFVNSSIIIKFKGVWGVGDYFLDLDNINYLRTVVSNEEVDNQIDKTSVLMYPNPTDEITNVNVTLTKASDIDIDLVNISGQLIQTYHSSKSQVHNVKLDLQNYPLGVYFVRVKPTDGQSVTSKLIKVQ